MEIHYNEIKSSIKELYSVLKKIKPFESALLEAIDIVVDRINYKDVVNGKSIFQNNHHLKEYLKEELKYQVNIVVDDPGGFGTLFDEKGHIDWYKQTVSSEEIDFRFWRRYKKYLSNIKDWNENVISKLDSITDEILDRIENPKIKNRHFDRRGLVVGHVQSGKTANFMGLINKSIDCGYSVIVVLSGIHDNLRCQTQMRIDEEVIGRDTSSNSEIKKIGVCTLPGEQYINVDTFTTQNDKGDFNSKTLRNIGVQPSPDRPMIFVVKKNASSLKNLIEYFNNATTILNDNFVTQSNNRKIINNLPLLIIDDEADQASPNTNAISNDDGELDPKSINKKIRELLLLFNQRVYIGYTATPFANIFIHHDQDHSVFGQDLFPSSFILAIEPPSNYFGPQKIFGTNDEEFEERTPIHISVLDAAQEDSEFLPLRHKSHDVPNFIPESMKEALKSFILSSAVRIIRGQSKKHNTMLIHCTRYTSIQNAVAEFVEDEFNILKNGIVNNDFDTIQKLKELWDRDYNRISLKFGYSKLDWSTVNSNLKQAVQKIENKPLRINGEAKDLLDYKNKQENGMSVIIIGGDKLSRGLTIEGLTVSYFTRTSSLYDTLMQMGRWFGYRHGYEDLCRIYTTNDLFNWYRHITTAFNLLLSDFNEMLRQRATPVEFGLRVLSHPDMMATNAMKMRYAESVPLAYNGRFTETVTLSNNADIKSNNFKAFQTILNKLLEINENPKNYLWENVNYEIIKHFFETYITSKDSPAANTNRIIEYIENGDNLSILQNWNVALCSLKSSVNGVYQISGLSINPITRSIKRKISNEKLYIKRLGDPGHERLDFKIDTQLTGEELRRTEPRLSTPMLILYPMFIVDKKENIQIDEIHIGFGVSWPYNSRLKNITYDINSVFRELEIDKYDD